LKTTLGTFNLKGSLNALSISGDKVFTGFPLIAKIIPFLLIPFFWIVTYFRLTEKQV